MIPADFLQIDLPAIMAAVLACLACSVAGTFLVLRRQSLMGDAISHAILPGIVLGFLIAGTRATMPMMAGSLAAALIAALMIELLRHRARMEAGAAMGVTFTILFAFGILLIEQAAARSVDLDADCVLYGQLEDILWLAPRRWSDLLSARTWLDLPREVVTLACVSAAIAGVTVLFFKEITVAIFDPVLSTMLGFRTGLVHLGLTGLAAIAAVASFEAVGSILVIAMLICPPATARLLTDRLKTQIWLSAVIGMACGTVGYILAAWGPFWLGGNASLNAAGMIAVTAGLVLGLTVLLAPRYGVLFRPRKI
ncbi:MAG: metal ABC transporter permease [Pseudomonadota bacterium]|nr:metal ABC transporter permease [Pseudomonadota bacterium]